MNLLTNNKNKFLLIAKIKGLALEIAKTHNSISKTIKPEYSSILSNRKVFLSDKARHALLAYGFLKGKKYKALEHKTKSKPNANSILDEIMLYAPRYMRDSNNRFIEFKPKHEDITKWLEESNVVEQ